ncbi:hypothetical protein COH20_012403 [Aspergillus flavus]|uniref:Cyanovirin-N domain-containing protein n=1 Tax=Aspergillus flavus TaxID=5059 RepID=A0AB74CP74_ASPFL|nr:hypothetical protein COH20_012403 [Aspergillus flavus]RMZ48168.1 hypothetical protein CA14_008424 [Aspergillus flavus]
MRLQAFILVLLGLGKSYAAHFSKTCSSFELEGSMLFAKCQESPDKERHTTVDLNKCLGHKDGTLVRGENAIGNLECGFCMLAGTQIQCMCYRGKGVIAPSSPLNLDDVLSNQGGTLACDGQA